MDDIRNKLNDNDRVIHYQFHIEPKYKNINYQNSLLKKIFPKHGIENVGYWIDDANPEDLIYVLKHVGDPATNWKNFGDDEEWKSAKAASEVNGRLVASIESKFMSATDFSEIR